MAAPSSNTVVLLHASASSARQWDALAEGLRPAFDVHAVDLHGHGRQPPWAAKRPLRVHDEAALALPAIEAAGGVHLVGHSYGAAVALHLAVARPSLVRSLCLYEPPLFSLLADHDPLSAAALQAFELAASLHRLVREGDAPAAAARFIDYWSGAGTWAQLGAERQRSFAARMPTVVQHFDALYGAPLPPQQLARLTMPLLCLTGARSTAAALRVGSLLRRLLPAAQHETLHGMGHMGPITHAARVNQRLMRFLGAEALPVPEVLPAAMEA